MHLGGENDEVEFSLEAKVVDSDKWVGIAFSNDLHMVKSRLYYCIILTCIYIYMHTLCDVIFGM